MANKDPSDLDAPTAREVRLRQSLMNKVRTTPNPLFQSLMDLEKLGEPFGIETIMDYDPDTTDIDERPY